MAITVHPATPERWADLEALFGGNGACAGCWCQFFKLSRPEYEAGRGEKNKRRLRESVERGTRPGLIAYDGDQPVGWAALEPKERYPRLARARILKGVDDAPAWSLPCFFVARSHRGRGIMTALLKAAAKNAKAEGATLLEGYPMAPSKRTGDAFAYVGVVGPFEKAGFEEAARPSPTRRVMRRRLRVP
jgi:GNAT superfamily N-acetyltransferase